MGAGVVVQAGIVDKGTTWDGSVGTANIWLPMLSESLTAEFAKIQSESLGQVSIMKPDNGAFMVTGDIVCELDYNYGFQMLEYALGSGSTTFNTTDDLVNYFDLWIDKGVTRFQYPSCSVNSMTISAAMGSVPTITYNVTAYTQIRSATAIASLFPASSLQERFNMQDLVVGLGDKAGVLASGDNISVTGFELTLENNLQNDAVASGAASGFVLNPVRNGFRTGNLKLDFPRYGQSGVFDTADSHPLHTWKDANTELQTKLTFTGSTGSLIANCPSIFLSEGANAEVSGPEQIPYSATFDLVAGANTWMTGADQLQFIKG